MLTRNSAETPFQRSCATSSVNIIHNTAPLNFHHISPLSTMISTRLLSKNNVWPWSLSKYQEKFYTGTVCGACDKYEVCWEGWGKCSSATRSKTRVQHVLVDPKHGGAACQGLYETAKCKSVTTWKRCKRPDPKSLDKWHRDHWPQSSACSSHLPSPSLFQKNITEKTSGNIAQFQKNTWRLKNDKQI